LGIESSHLTQSFLFLSPSLFISNSHTTVIDKELNRLAHKDEIDAAVQKKNEAVLEKSLPQGFDFDEGGLMMETVMAPRQKRKDKRLARDDPQAYCADRCIATGNCEVFEDIFKYSPEEVVAFCEECVLSDEEEPCDVPDALFEGDSNDSPLKP